MDHNQRNVTLYCLRKGMYSCKGDERFEGVGYGSTPEEALAHWQGRTGLKPHYIFGGIKCSKTKANLLQPTLTIYL